MGGRHLEQFVTFVATVGVAISAAAPVTADPDNPYSGLSCSCPSQGAGHGRDVPDITEGIAGICGRMGDVGAAGRHRNKPVLAVDEAPELLYL